MRTVANLSQEFDELCAEYSAHDEQGKDIVILVKLFGDQYHHLRSEAEPDFKTAWSTFLEEHKDQVTTPMVGLILYVLITYWDMGHMLYVQLPPMERTLVRDTVQDISDEIERRSKANDDADDHAQRSALA